MIKRLYVHNFRCLNNFDLALGAFQSVLLVGKNGVGKSTVGSALELLQRIARGTNRVGNLISPKDLTSGRTGVPAWFEVEVVLLGQNYTYSIAFELPAGFRELRVVGEKLTLDGNPIFTREFAQVRLVRNGQPTEASFRIDWHLVALPIVQENDRDDPLWIFKTWLKNILILRPVPFLMRGDSDLQMPEPEMPNTQVTNLGAWFSGMITASPSAYTPVNEYLRQVMPDFDKIANLVFGKETRNLIFHFSGDQGKIELATEQLSDGEKCFVVFALTIALNSTLMPVLCFWDEPDNFLAPEEVGHSIMALRRAFLERGQLIVTSHNPEAISRFSNTNTLYLSRESHFQHTLVTLASNLQAGGKYDGRFVDALVRGDIGG